MNCPNCGSNTLADQQYCRSCGAELTAEKPRRDPRAFGLLMLVFMLGGMLITMTGKFMDLRWLLFTGAFIMVGGMFLMVALLWLRQAMPRRRREIKSQPVGEFEKADTTNKLPPISAQDEMPSVVDATTSLLEVPVGQSIHRD